MAVSCAVSVNFAFFTAPALADTTVQQVMIESRFIIVNQKFADEIGVDWANALKDAPGVLSDATGLGLGNSPSGETITQKLFPDTEGGPITLNGLLTEEQVDAVVAAIAKEKKVKTIEEPVVYSGNNTNTRIDIPATGGLPGGFLMIVPQISPDGQIQMGVSAGKTTVTEEKPPLIGDIPVLGTLFRNSKTGEKQNLIILVRPYLIDALSPSSGGYEEGDPVKTDIVGTGETIGHIADVKLENMTNGSLIFIIPPCIIESESGKNQATFSPGSDKIELAAHQKKTVPLEGVCLEQGKPAAAKGNSDDLVMNTGDSKTKSNRNAHLPADKVESTLRLASCVYDAVHEMMKQGAYKKFPGVEEERERIALQWATWANPDIAEAMGGKPATKDDMKEVVKKQQKTPVTPATEKKIDKAVDSMWEQIELTTGKAKDLEKQESPSGEST